MISASLQGGKRGSGGSLSRRRQRWKLTHQLWVESQTRIKDAQTVRFRSQSCHLFRLSLQRLLTRSRSSYFSFTAVGEKEEATPHGLSASMISASPHGEKEAAVRFLVGGSDGSSRISFGWNRKLASKMLKQCDSAAKAVICFAYRCSASSHALAAAISASLQGGKEEAAPREAQRRHDFSHAL